MKKTASTVSPALQFLTLAWEKSTYPSHRQKNATMQQALRTAITSGMKFDPNDVFEIYRRFRAGHWIGESNEGYYREAVAFSNLSACTAWETFFGRPPLMWQETAAKPERLHRGSLMTWKGHILKVTSFNDEKKHLVACSYRKPAKPEGFLEWNNYEQRQTDPTGRIVYSHDVGGFRKVLHHRTTPEGHVIFHYGPPVAGEWDEDEVEDRRFKIGYDELLAARKAADARARSWVKRLQSAVTLTTLDKDAQACSAAHRSDPFRHFDLETFQAALKARRTDIERQLSKAEREEQERQVRAQRREQQEQHLPAWLAGEKVPISFFDITPHRLRVLADRVEVTNGNSVPRSEAVTALAFAKKHRKKGWQAKEGTDIYVGAHLLKEITSETVTIGCTTLEWTEIDRIAPSLKA